MRGAPVARLVSAESPRIIPADAGSTRSCRSGHACPEDHPRGCGEHGNWLEPQLRREGSSPRMRGARLGEHERIDERRIIPADAGSTSGLSACPDGPGDHPRGCGEHNTTEWEDPWKEGSSPRMRGARLGAFGLGAGRGIIPADAGSTKSLLMPSTPQPDHPRGCGEHPGRCSLLMRARGSSPQMRGALSCHIRPSID